jgi:hypothetical protein
VTSVQAIKKQHVVRILKRPILSVGTRDWNQYTLFLLRRLALFWSRA